MAVKLPVVPRHPAATPGCPRRVPKVLARSLSGVPDPDTAEFAAAAASRSRVCAPVGRAESTGLVMSWSEARRDGDSDSEGGEGSSSSSSRGSWDAELEREYEIEGALGYGATAEVLLGCARGTGARVAIKKIPRAFVLRKEFRRISKEIRILRQLQHPNLIAYRDAFITQRFLYIILEYAEGRTLFDEIQDRRRLSEHEAAVITRGVARGLVYLHSHGIVHADLKPENIIIGDAATAAASDTASGTASPAQPPLLSPTPRMPVRITVTDTDVDDSNTGTDIDDSPAEVPMAVPTAADSTDDDGEFSVKIIDFGLAKMVPSLHQERPDGGGGSGSCESSSDSESEAETAGGTLAYRAPELLHGGASTPAADVWALGVILFTMLGGYPPFMSDESALADVAAAAAAAAAAGAPFWYYCNSDTPLLRERIDTVDLAFVDECWAGVSERARDVVRLLLCRDPADRLTAAQLLALPWLRDADRLPRTRPAPPSSRSQSRAASREATPVPSPALRALSVAGTPDDDGALACAQPCSVGHTYQVLDRVLRDKTKLAAILPPRTLSRRVPLPPPSQQQQALDEGESGDDGATTFDE